MLSTLKAFTPLCTTSRALTCHSRRIRAAACLFRLGRKYRGNSLDSISTRRLPPASLGTAARARRSSSGHWYAGLLNTSRTWVGVPWMGGWTKKGCAKVVFNLVGILLGLLSWYTKYYIAEHIMTWMDGQRKVRVKLLAMFCKCCYLSYYTSGDT